MRNYFRVWGVSRILRLVLGIVITGQSIQAGNWLFVVLGSLFSLMPLLNIGCCGVSGCSTSLPQGNGKIEDISYEEVR